MRTTNQKINNKIHENNKPKNRVLMDFIFYRFNKFSEVDATRIQAVIFVIGNFEMIDLFSLYNLNTREHILTLSFYHKRYNDDKIKRS